MNATTGYILHRKPTIPSRLCLLINKVIGFTSLSIDICHSSLDFVLLSVLYSLGVLSYWI